MRKTKTERFAALAKRVAEKRMPEVASAVEKCRGWASFFVGARDTKPLPPLRSMQRCLGPQVREKKRGRVDNAQGLRYKVALAVARGQRLRPEVRGRMSAKTVRVIRVCLMSLRSVPWAHVRSVGNAEILKSRHAEIG